MLQPITNQRIALLITRRTALRQLALPLALCLLLLPVSAKADPVTDWNAIGATAALNAGKGPPALSIDLAYMHVAIYDAVNAIDGRYSVYAVKPSNVPPDASKDAAAVAAAYNVLKSLLPAQQAFLDSQYATSLAAIPNGDAKTHGIAVGEEVASLFLWVAQMRPFAILSPSQYRAEGPPLLGSAQWAADFNETKNLGAANSATRTAEQTEIGRFYAEHTGVQFARVFRDFAAEQDMSLADNARLFAVLYVSVADALIAVWDSKYHFSFWRPVTAIRSADTDGNPATDADPAWLSLVATPNHPEYPAAHGAFTGAYAEALRRFFDTKRVAITLTSTVTGTSRTFSKTDQLIDEVIEARIYGGMHYRTSCEHGAEMGKKVAKWVAKHYFKPVN